MEGVATYSPGSVARYLLQLRIITSEQSAKAEERCRANGNTPFAYALVEGGVAGDTLAAVLGRANGPSAIDVDGLALLPHVVNLIPEATAFEQKMLPVHRTESLLFVAVPRTWKGGPEVAKIQKQTGLHVEPVPVQRLDIPGLVTKCHQLLKTRSLRERRIGKALVERGLITAEQLATALKLQKQKNMRIGQALTELGFLSEKVFYQVLSERLKIPLRDTAFLTGRLQPEVCRKVTQAFAEHNMLLPLATDRETLLVATSYPVDPNTLETLKPLTGSSRVELVLVDEASLLAVIKSVYASADLSESRPGDSSKPGVADDLDLEVSVEDVSDTAKLDDDVFTDPNVPRIINYMLYQAVKKGASDIHIEQYEDRADIKFRIDGQMRSITGIPVDRENVARIISKLKIDAELDIAERRKPQDGSFRKKFGEKLLVDFRLAIQPTLYGENAVIRILDRTSPLPTIPQLGMPEEILKRYLRQIGNPQGMVIFTGPTGSGKTTTLYCTLEVLRKQSLKIITAEDPIEYQFDGIQQCQVSDQIGNTFAKYLRGFLRQDPDVILIGEVRDEDTAVNAVRAAITGHLIFTTIHASDTIGVIRRFLDMGVDTNMLSMSLVSIIYQRLVRRICVNCKAPHEPKPEELAELQLTEVLKGVQLYKGAGCEICDGTGYRGRIAVYEMWEPGDEERDHIAKGSDERVLRAEAIKSGMKPLVVDAVSKVKAGVTTLEELLEVIPFNQITKVKDYILKK